MLKPGEVQLIARGETTDGIPDSFYRAFNGQTYHSLDLEMLRKHHDEQARQTLAEVTRQNSAIKNRAHHWRTTKQ